MSPWRLVLLFGLGLAATGLRAEPFDTRLSLTNGHGALAEQALDQLATGFLGGTDLPGIDLDFGSVSVVLPRGWEIGVETSAPLGRRGGVLRTGVSVGRQTYRLPDGVGILADPAKLTLEQVSAWAELGYRRRLLPVTGLDADVAMGLLGSHARARFRSALIDRAETLSDVTGYASGGLSVPIGAAGGRLGLRVTRHATGVTDLRIGLSAGF